MRATVILLISALAALTSASSVGAGMGNPDVAALQVALRSHSLQAGAVDGVLGPQTASAVLAFQAAEGLAQTGTADADTVSALGGPHRALTRHRAPAGARCARTRGGALTSGATGWEVAAREVAAL